jgi:hypothetical protein
MPISYIRLFKLTACRLAFATRTAAFVAVMHLTKNAASCTVSSVQDCRRRAIVLALAAARRRCPAAPAPRQEQPSHGRTGTRGEETSNGPAC